MERAYNLLEYMKGMMDILTSLENVGLVDVPSEFQNRLNLASTELRKGHYKSCIKICNTVIPEIRQYAKEKGKCLKEEK